jgi:diguanylate cyclase (GGDEF)-like protein/PAS domain S-box-containing protein
MGSQVTSVLFEKNSTITIKELVKKLEELKKSEERYRIVSETTKDIIWEGDLVNNKRYFYGRLYEILGYKPIEMERLDEWFNIVHPEDVSFVKEGIKHQIQNKIAVKTFEYRVKCKNGSYKWLLSSTKCEFNEKDEAVSVFGAFTDITELKEQEKRIHDLAYHDPITGLPNRLMLSEVIDDKIKKASKNRNKFSMIFIDIDNFKFINDSYGHLTGDKLLSEVGNKLKETQDNKTMFFRLGGDEFIVLIENIYNKEQVEEFLNYLYKVLSNPIFIDEKIFNITYSSGVVIYPKDGDTFQELLKNADTAMYKSKELGKHTNSFYNEKMGEAAIKKAEIQSDLHTAIRNNEFKLYYQPIVDISLRKIKGCEALIRWIHPEYGMIFPDKFISMAEENGTIIEIEKWVIENACQYAKRMYERGYTDFYVSINISPHHLLKKEFTSFILSTIKRAGIKPELIIIEITESVLIKAPDLVINKLKELKCNNIKIALDDFGCGYSSLTYLRMLPANIVKIDRTFIADIESGQGEKNITNIIILLAKQLGLKVIAEGVEDKYQLDYLKKYNCDMFQGYLISKPVPENEFLNLMKSKTE